MPNTRGGTMTMHACGEDIWQEVVAHGIEEMENYHLWASLMGDVEIEIDYVVIPGSEPSMYDPGYPPSAEVECLTMVSASGWGGGSDDVSKVKDVLGEDTYHSMLWFIFSTFGPTEDEMMEDLHRSSRW